MAKASMVLLTLLGVGCAGIHPEPWLVRVETVLRDSPLADDENIRVTDLGKTGSLSHHLVQIRYAEPLHVHHLHDLSVFVYRGTGSLTVGTNLFEVVTGDVLFIPRDVAHKFVNTADGPAVAIVTFTPGLSAKDFVLVPEK